jgi:hypothetical protein
VEQFAQLIVNVFGPRDRLGDLGAQRIATLPTQTMHCDLDGPSDVPSSAAIWR